MKDANQSGISICFKYKRRELKDTRHIQAQDGKHTITHHSLVPYSFLSSVLFLVHFHRKKTNPTCTLSCKAMLFTVCFTFHELSTFGDYRDKTTPKVKSMQRVKCGNDNGVGYECVFKASKQ